MSSATLTGVLAKLSGLSSVAKAGVGLAVTAGVLGAAAAVPAMAEEAGALDDGQVVVATTDEPTTEPTDEPTTEPADEPTTEPTDEPADEPSEESTDETVDHPAVALPGWQDYENFGAWVSAQAREGGVDGQVISEAAHERNRLRQETRAAQDADEAPDADEAEDADDATEQARGNAPTCDEDCTPAGSSGKSNGNGNGVGNGKKG